MLRRWLYAICLALVALPAWCAGPAGHVIIAGKTIDAIRAGKISAPPELRMALENPAARRAYAGGAVGPDVIEAKSHYGNTADLARRLLAEARADMQAAAGRKDTAAFDKARTELAFAYGWLNHMSADLNVHPVVNARVGDTFRFNTPTQQKMHALNEAQLTAYLISVVGKGKYPYDVSIPYEALSRATGVPIDDLKAGAMKLRAKAIGEYATASHVTVDANLKRIWFDAINGTMRDNAGFVANPNAIGNWDLDCGRISTTDFDNLRRMVMEANGGTLPTNWGKMYMIWWNQVKDLPYGQRMAKLKELLGTQPTVVKAPTVTPGPTKLSGKGVWVLVEIQGKDENQAPNTCKATFSETGFSAEVDYVDAYGTEQKFTAVCNWSPPSGSIAPGSVLTLTGSNVSIEADLGSTSLGRSNNKPLTVTVPSGNSPSSRMTFTFSGTSVAGRRKLVWDTRAYTYAYVPAGSPMPDPKHPKRIVVEARK